MEHDMPGCSFSHSTNKAFYSRSEQGCSQVSRSEPRVVPWWVLSARASRVSYWPCECRNPALGSPRSGVSATTALPARLAQPQLEHSAPESSGGEVGSLNTMHPKVVGVAKQPEQLTLVKVSPR